MYQEYRDPIQLCLNAYLAWERRRIKIKADKLEARAQTYLLETHPLNANRFLAIEMAYESHKKAKELRNSLHHGLEVPFIHFPAISYMYLMHVEG